MSIPCRYFASGNCRFGDSCFYLHEMTEAQMDEIFQENELNTNPPKFDQSSASNVRNKMPSKANDYKSKFQKNEISSLWNFSEDNDSDGIYFYGAPGTDFESNKPIIKYSDIIKCNLNEQERERIDNQPKSTPNRQICTFYKIGCCKYGSFCRNIHDTISEYPKMNEKIKEHDISCGICLQQPSMYGLLSHCNCYFCLECIRNWRKEGITVTKSTENLRLCPLCRKESYFIIPSNIHMINEEKDNLIETYKDSLSKIQCKYYSENLECPFGTSCLYRHGDLNEKINQIRYLYKEEGDVISLSKIKLSDFIIKK